PFTTNSEFGERRLLVYRVISMIEKYDLPVPRSLSTRFINYDFWSSVFNRIFGIKCDKSLRMPVERVEMIKGCLNMLESLIGVKLDHIQAERLLNFDAVSMRNLIEITELWDKSFE